MQVLHVNLIICFSVSILQRILWNFGLDGRVNIDLSLHCQCCLIFVFFSLEKNNCAISAKEKASLLSAEMICGEQCGLCFFHVCFFFWSIFRWMEPILKPIKWKCAHSFSRLGPFILFYLFIHRVMTDLPSLLDHLPLRQVTGKGSKVSGKKRGEKKKRDQNACLHICAVRRREHSFPSLYVALLCLVVYPLIWVSLETQEGRDSRGEACLQGERRVWLL